MCSIENFRKETRGWLEANCPASMRTRMVAGEDLGGGRKRKGTNPDAYVWLGRMAEKGWTAPTWPKEYGGGGLPKDEFLILLEELQRIKARPPLSGMGISMIGPTLLEYGTEDQKQRHLPSIIKGDIAWCQGYSEPGAGSDLASLQTRAEDKGDYYLVNGSKVWTSGAMHADWIFCLVRTNPQAPKHEGISFLLFSMDSPGVSVKPIEMLNGHSPFCQTFFDDVEVSKIDLVHKENQGWSVAKRLLQHERSGLASLASADKAGPLQRIKPSMSLADLAKHYADSDVIADAALRDEIVVNEMQKRAFNLTQARAVAESEANTPGAATSIFKYIEAEYVKDQLELQNRARGTQALGWEGDAFTREEISMCRLNLEAKSISIAGGSNEIQLNIIAKRVLGLPDG
ncbi:MAG: acyl-CoA dehydrogenase family protein [Pseudomonadales bacterium]|nr:acyl-CoA dehydrogenase family protein [Pseudomonadales bacterium]